MTNKGIAVTQIARAAIGQGESCRKREGGMGTARARPAAGSFPSLSLSWLKAFALAYVLLSSLLLLVSVTEQSRRENFLYSSTRGGFHFHQSGFAPLGIECFVHLDSVAVFNCSARFLLGITMSWIMFVKRKIKKYFAPITVSDIFLTF